MKKNENTLTRSQNMRKIKSTNTKPEIYIRKLLYKLGYRYRINYSELPGKPDIYISKYKTVIFVNGCFWHQHENCKMATIPKTHTDFWLKKLKRNVDRDIEIREELFEMGISVINVWGCEIKKIQKNEEYRVRYIQIIRNRIENIFNYSEKDISLELKILKENNKYEV